MKSRYDFKTEQEWLDYLRFYYAGMAMQGMTSNCYKDHPDQHIAESSVLLADALIEALNKTEK